jgi:hypothetical protein
VELASFRGRDSEEGVPMQRLTLVFAVILSSAILVPAAFAEKPTREPLPAASLVISGSCSFDVQVDFLVNKEFITTFTSGKQIITGRLVVRLTNLSDPTKSTVQQISGPGINDLSDPSTFNLSGTSLVFFPGVLVLTHGPVSLTFDASGNVTSFTQTSASSVDMCAVLADP